MAKIDENEIYKFKTGDIVDADVAPTGGALNPIFELIRVSINHTDARVDGVYTKGEVDEFLLSGVADNSLTNTKLAADVKIGSLAALTTTNKSSVVSAVNETVAQLADKAPLSHTTTKASPTVIGHIKPDDVTGRVGGDGTFTVLNSSIPYGEIELPSDFPKPPFGLYRDRDGLIKHNYNLAQYDTGDVTIYVNNDTGVDTNDGLSEGAAIKTLTKAIDNAIASAGTQIVIKVMGSYLFDRFEIPTTVRNISNKRVTITTLNPNDIYYVGCAEGLTYTLESGKTYTYKAARTNVSGVADFTSANRDVFNIPRPYIKKASVDEVEALPGSYYTDGTTVWIHTLTGAAPSGGNVVALVNVHCLEFNLSNATLVIKNAHIYNGGRYQGLFVYGNKASTFIHSNVAIYHSNHWDEFTDEGNGLATSDLGLTLGFNSISAYNNRDGFNYHYSSIPAAQRRSCLAFEYNCIAYKSGVNSAQSNNNATTCHEGASVLRVGSIGYKTKGPICSDVNACYSILYDCHMRDSLLSPAPAKAPYYFDTSSAPAEVGNGKLIMVNCDGGGDVSYGLSLGGTVPTDVTLQHFRGFYFRNVTNPTVIV